MNKSRIAASIVVAGALIAILPSIRTVRAQSGAAKVAQVPGFNPDQCHPPSNDRPWMDRNQTPECRALEVMAQMSREDKIAFRGSSEKLGLTAPPGQDGPNGIAGGWMGPPQPRQKDVTAFPNVITLAATWDRDLAHRFGEAVGEEFAGKGMASCTGPTINLLRTWHWGRSAETFGEDPYLMGEMVVPEITGMQSHKVIAVVKHFAGNNQENTRVGVYPDNAGIDERITQKALNEIYLPHFKEAVEKGHNGAIMCAYNQINGEFACNSPSLLGRLREWGFDGFIEPDAFFAQRSVYAAAKAGVDRVSSLEEVDSLIQAGKLPQATLDLIVFHTMVPYFRLGIYDAPPTGTPDANVSTPEHIQLSKEIASAGAVLLKNTGSVLPIGSRVKTLAIIGDDAGENAQVMETGSAHVFVGKLSTPLEGIRERAGNSVKVVYARGTLGIGPLPAIPANVIKPASGSGEGFLAVYYKNAYWDGEPAITRVDAAIDFPNPPSPDFGSPAPTPGPPGAGRGRGGGGGAPRAAWSARWTGTLTPPSTGVYRFSITGGGTGDLFVDDRPVVTLMRADFPTTAQGLIHLTAGRPVPVEFKYSSASNLLGREIKLGWQPPDPAMLAEAVSAAKQADVAVVFAGEEMGEGHDKTFLNLPGDQDALIEAVAQANPKTVVVLHTSNPVAMPWLDRVASVIEAWYPGQRADSIASVLFGDVNPSGKLPVTFPANDRQGPATNWTEYPGDGRVAYFTEGVLVGYRWYDAKNQQPLFPFGHGLSYTTFKYSNFALEGSGEKRSARVRITNTGSRAGAEVVQMYLGYPAESLEPPRALKGFEKVSLKPGESKTVRLAVDHDALAIFDEAANGCTVKPGVYTVAVGSSSRDIRASGTFNLSR